MNALCIQAPNTHVLLIWQTLKSPADVYYLHTLLISDCHSIIKSYFITPFPWGGYACDRTHVADDVLAGTVITCHWCEGGELPPSSPPLERIKSTYLITLTIQIDMQVPTVIRPMVNTLTPHRELHSCLHSGHLPTAWYGSYIVTVKSQSRLKYNKVMSMITRVCVESLWQHSCTYVVFLY